MKYRVIRHVRLLVLLCMLPVANARSDQPGVTILGSAFTGTPFHVTGNIVAESDSLYETLRDYSDPAAPRVLGWLDHGSDSFLSDLLYDDGLAVGLTRPEGLGIIGFIVSDISNPAAPVEYGSFAGMGFDSGWLRGRAFTASSSELLVTYDLTQPSSPSFTAFSPLGAHAGSRWPVAVGNTLFMIDHDSSVRALDVADAFHPANLGLTAIAGDRIDALAGGEGVLYALVAVGVGLADERLELVTCDVSTPGVPVETDRQVVTAVAGTRGRSLVRSGDLLVAATADGIVCAYGMADAAHPAAGWKLAHDATRVVVTPSVILIREGRALVSYTRTAWDVTPTSPVLYGHLPVLGPIVGQGPVQIATYNYHSEWISTVDVTDPYRPRLSPPVNFYAGGLQYVDGLGSVGSGNACWLADLSDPAKPRNVGYVSAPSPYLRSHLVSRRLMAFETSRSDLKAFLFDISDPAAPVAAGWFAEQAVLDMDDNLAAGATDGGVRLYDLTDLGSPQLLGSLPSPGRVLYARFWRGHLYTVTERVLHERLLETWDVTDPSSPTLVSSLPLAFLPWRMDLHGNRLYVQSSSDVQVFDLAEPAAPVSLAAFHHAAAIPGFAVNGNLTTVSAHLLTFRNDGLSAATVPRPGAMAAARLSPAWPNPFNPSTSLSFAIEGERELALSIYDVRGRHLVELARGRFDAGEHHVTWDGTDATGSTVAAGVYLVRLHGEGVEAVTSVTLLK